MNTKHLTLLAGAGVLVSASLMAQAESQARHDFAPDELLIKWAGGHESEAAVEGHRLIGGIAKRNLRNLGWQIVRLPAGMTIQEGLSAYRALPAVLEVEPSTVHPVPALPHVSSPNPPPRVSLLSAPSSVPNDPRFRSQWNLRTIGVTNAWKVTTGSSNIVVAVIDSGIAYQHEDLAANMWVNPGETGLDAQGRDRSTNGVDDDDNGYIDDVHGADVLDDDGDPNENEGANYHGTQAAGIVGACGNNGKGIVGINWEVRLMAVRIWAVRNDAGIAIITDAAKLAAFEYVLEMKRRGTNIRVITVIGVGAGYQPGYIYDAYQAMQDAGILITAVAGNAALNNDAWAISQGFHEIPNLIIVAASEEGDIAADYSSYGPTSVDLFAPSTTVLSTTLNEDGYTASTFGTSFAMPHVAGAAALLIAARPEASPLDIKAALLHSVDQRPAFNMVVSRGRLNVGRAMEMLRPDDFPPVVVHASPGTSRTLTTAAFEVWFSRPMDRASTEAAFQAEPPVSGTFQWADDSKSFRLIPSQPLVRARHRARILGSAAAMGDGGAGMTLDGNFNRIIEGTGKDDFVWTFTFAPENDLFRDALPISGFEGSVSRTTFNATGEDAAPVESAWNPQTFFFASLWYRWTAPQDGWVTFETLSALDTAMAIYSGSAITNLVRISANDNDGNRKTSRLSIAARVGETYSLTAVTGDPLIPFDSMGGLTLRWYPTPAPALAPIPFLPAAGSAGGWIELRGTNLTGATAILFGASQAQFTVSTNYNLLDRQIYARIPSDAEGGPVTIVTPHGTITSPSAFEVLPPPLIIRQLGTGVLEIAWPSTSPVFVLERTDALVEAAWGPVATGPLRRAGSSAIEINADKSGSFFRLRSR